MKKPTILLEHQKKNSQPFNNYKALSPFSTFKKTPPKNVFQKTPPKNHILGVTFSTKVQSKMINPMEYKQNNRSGKIIRHLTYQDEMSQRSDVDNVE